MVTWNVSTLVPSKTVSPYPVMPVFTESTGKMPGKGRAEAAREGFAFGAARKAVSSVRKATLRVYFIIPLNVGVDPVRPRGPRRLWRGPDRGVGPARSMPGP